jgi:hypothetical protein
MKLDRVPLLGLASPLAYFNRERRGHRLLFGDRLAAEKPAWPLFLSTKFITTLSKIMRKISQTQDTLVQNLK